MQEDFGDIAMQCDLLASNAIIEVSRVGGSGQFFALQAATLSSLSQVLDRDNRTICEPGEADDLAHEIELRLDILARGQDYSSAFSVEIETNLQLATPALQFEDVESQVVVYSNDPATNLRAPVTRIEGRQSALQAGIVANQDDLRPMTDSSRRRLEALSDDSRQGPICAASQNSLDHSDSEMF